MAPHLGGRFLDAERGPVRPVLGQRIPRVAHTDQRHGQRHLLRGGTVGIAETVEPLVVPAGEWHEWRKPGDLGEPAGTDDRVLPHHRPLRLTERLGLLEHAAHHAHLTDVMDQRTPIDLGDERHRQTRVAGDLYGERCNPA